LTHEQLAGLERMAEKSAQNLLDAIERSRHRTFDRFINGLGIRHVGESTARALALRFKTIDALRDASEDDLRAVRDIGDEVARSIREYFDEPRTRKAVERRMKHVDLKPLEAPSAQGRAALRDKSFVLTGTLETVAEWTTRDRAEFTAPAGVGATAPELEAISALTPCDHGGNMGGPDAVTGIDGQTKGIAASRTDRLASIVYLPSQAGDTLANQTSTLTFTWTAQQRVGGLR